MVTNFWDQGKNKTEKMLLFCVIAILIINIKSFLPPLLGVGSFCYNWSPFNRTAIMPNQCNREYPASIPLSCFDS